MKIHTLFLLKWKSFIRHPLVEQTITIRLVIGVYLISLLFFLYILGSFLEQSFIILFPMMTNPLLLFACSALVLLVIDFILKFLFRKSDYSQYINFLRFYKSKRTIYTFIILQEFCNLWNYYLPFFFFSYLRRIIYPDYGSFTVISLLFILCITQILISLWIGKIKSNSVERKFIPFFSLNLFPDNSNYLSLNVKMIMRSPRLRQQLLVYLLLAAALLFIIQNKIPVNSFLAQLLFQTGFLSLFPMLFNQFLFSADASFFDYLMISPGFKKILTARYILYLLFSGLSFFILLFMNSLSWERFIELTAVLLYSAGTITLLSFCGILFAEKKMDLFGSFYESFTNTNSVQAIVVTLSFLLSLFLIVLIVQVFSLRAAVYFMMISGGIFILSNQLWFNYLYRCFHSNRYEKMENYRIQ